MALLEEIIVSRKFIFFLYSRSPVTLSPWKSGESYLSKDQRKTPLTCPKKVNQTCEKDRTGILDESGWRPDPVKKKGSGRCCRSEVLRNCED